MRLFAILLNRTRLIGMMLIVVPLLVLAACSEDDKNILNLVDIDRGPEKAIVVPPGEPIVIGTSTGLTGSVGPRGTEYRDAVILSLERWKEANGALIGGHEIEVQAEDDGCTAVDVTKVAAKRLLSRQGLVGVIGPQCSGGSGAVIPIYAEAGVVTISGSATRTDLTLDQPEGNFFFRTAFRNDLEGTLIGNFLGQLAEQAGGNYIAYLIDDAEPYGIDLTDTAQAAAEENGVTIVRDSVPQGVVDFSEVIGRILESGANFVGYAGFNPEAGLLLRQLRDAGFTGLYGSVDAAASQSDFVEPLGPTAEGALFAGCQVDLSKSFSDDFFELHGYERGGATFSGHYYDAATVLLNAVKEVAQLQSDGSLLVKPTDLRNVIRDSFLQQALTGTIAFDENGDRVPEPGDNLSDVIARGFAIQDSEILESLGFIQCQVQDGMLVNVSGPNTPDVRLPN